MVPCRLLIDLGWLGASSRATIRVGPSSRPDWPSLLSYRGPLLSMSPYVVDWVAEKLGRKSSAHLRKVGAQLAVGIGGPGFRETDTTQSVDCRFLETTAMADFVKGLFGAKPKAPVPSGDSGMCFVAPSQLVSLVGVRRWP